MDSMVTKSTKDDSSNNVADTTGSASVDPTKNVLDLVRAESKYQDGMRDALERYLVGMNSAEGRFQDLARNMESKIHTALSAAESTRIDQLRDLRQVYEVRIADMLSKSVESTSQLVSSQLLQIQATFNERVSKLEQFRWESGGRNSVADPAIDDAIAKITEAMAKQATFITSLNETNLKGAARSGGISQMGAWILGGVVILISIVSPVITAITFMQQIHK